MVFKEIVRSRTRAAGNTVCVGLDPVLAKIALPGPPEERIRRFYGDMLLAMSARGILPAAVKPNIAYFEALGPSCLRVLNELIAAFRAAGVLVILDAKRGDIGTSSSAYARMAFDAFGADAVTVAPYMGSDSVRPFQEAGAQDGRGVYLLVRTSNPSARDFQDLLVEDASGGRVPLYLKVAAKLAEWDGEGGRGNLGAVIGATAPGELRGLLEFWKGLGREIPVLIPGIAVAGVSGGQNGSVGEVYGAVKDAGSDPWLHLVNSSSGINYAFEKYPSLKPADASAAALEELIGEIAKSL